MQMLIDTKEVIIVIIVEDSRKLSTREVKCIAWGSWAGLQRCGGVVATKFCSSSQHWAQIVHYRPCVAVIREVTCRRYPDEVSTGPERQGVRVAVRYEAESGCECASMPFQEVERHCQTTVMCWYALQTQGLPVPSLSPAGLPGGTRAHSLVAPSRLPQSANALLQPPSMGAASLLRSFPTYLS